MDPRRLHRRDGADRTGELTFERAPIEDALLELRRAEAHLVEALESHGTAPRQPTAGELEPELARLRFRDLDHGTVRFHSVGGWGAITTGKNLAMTLFELLGWHIKANPKYGSEKKGQPTTYYLSVAPEPIRINCEYFFVDAVLSPDPNVFQHTNALAGLKEGGVFVLQSEKTDPAEIWASV